MLPYGRAMGQPVKLSDNLVLDAPVPLSAALSSVDAPSGRERVRAHLASRPYPAFYAAHLERVGLRFVNADDLARELEVDTRLRSEPGLVAIDLLRQVQAYAGPRRVPVTGVDAALPGGERRVDPVAGDPAAAMRGLREGAALVSERPSRGVARRIPRTRSRLVELLSSRGRVEIVVEVVESGEHLRLAEQLGFDLIQGFLLRDRTIVVEPFAG